MNKVKLESELQVTGCCRCQEKSRDDKNCGASTSLAFSDTAHSQTFCYSLLKTLFIATLQVREGPCNYYNLFLLTEYADARSIGKGWGKAQSKARAGGLAPPGGLEGGLPNREQCQACLATWRNSSNSSSNTLRASSHLLDGQTHLSTLPRIPSLRTNANDSLLILSRHTSPRACKISLYQIRSSAAHTMVLSKMVGQRIIPTARITIMATSKVPPTPISRALPTARTIHMARAVPTWPTVITTL